MESRVRYLDAYSPPENYKERRNHEKTNTSSGWGKSTTR